MGRIRMYEQANEPGIRPVTRSQADRVHARPGRACKLERGCAPAPEATSEEPRLIAAGMSANTRMRMTALLSEMFDVLENRDVICPMYIPPCAAHLRFEELRSLLVALNEGKPGTRGIDPPHQVIRTPKGGRASASKQPCNPLSPVLQASPDLCGPGNQLGSLSRASEPA
jgi:hypothetical protein